MSLSVAFKQTSPAPQSGSPAQAFAMFALPGPDDIPPAPAVPCEPPLATIPLPPWPRPAWPPVPGAPPLPLTPFPPAAAPPDASPPTPGRAPPAPTSVPPFPLLPPPPFEAEPPPQAAAATRGSTKSQERISDRARTMFVSCLGAVTAAQRVGGGPDCTWRSGRIRPYQIRRCSFVRQPLFSATVWR